jgi:hypothetical protein
MLLVYHGARGAPIRPGCGTLKGVGTFGTVLIVVVGVAVLIAIISAFTAGDLYRSIGRGGLSLDEPDRAGGGPAPGSAAGRAEAEAEIRQMVEAKNEHRVRRGEQPLDVEAETAKLVGPGSTGHDEELRAEVRQLVVAKNERRVRRGEEPLDVEAEVDRQLRELG